MPPDDGGTRDATTSIRLPRRATAIDPPTGRLPGRRIMRPGFRAGASSDPPARPRRPARASPLAPPRTTPRRRAAVTASSAPAPRIVARHRFRGNRLPTFTAAADRFMARRRCGHCVVGAGTEDRRPARPSGNRLPPKMATLRRPRVCRSAPLPRRPRSLTAGWPTPRGVAAPLVSLLQPIASRTSIDFILGLSGRYRKGDPFHARFPSGSRPPPPHSGCVRYNGRATRHAQD